MPTICTRCEGTGFLNLHQVPLEILAYAHRSGEVTGILEWIKKTPDTDSCVCDCCGDTDDWYGTRGYHYGPEDPRGPNGPYAYNGGLCECN